jgi:hypothetical protein
MTQEELLMLLQLLSQGQSGDPLMQPGIQAGTEDYLDVLADMQLAQGRQLSNAGSAADLAGDINFGLFTDTFDYAQPGIPSGEAQFVPAATQALLEGADPNGTAIADLIANQGYSVPQALDTVFAPLAGDPEAQKAMLEKYKPLADTVFTEVVGSRTAAAQPAPMSPVREAAINMGLPDPIETYSAQAGNLPFDAYVQAMTERAQQSYGDIPITPADRPAYQPMAPAAEGETRPFGSGVLNLLPQLAQRQAPPGGWSKPDPMPTIDFNGTPLPLRSKATPDTYGGYTQDYWMDRADANSQRAAQLQDQQAYYLGAQGRTPFVDARDARLQALMQRLGLASS